MGVAVIAYGACGQTQSAPPVRTASQSPGARASGKSGAPLRPDVRWSRFDDPVEHAFTIDVPAGWRVSGGSRRMSAVEIRLGVNVTSPDGAITLFYGDSDVPIYTVPSRMLAMAGLRPGMYYKPGQGVQMLIEPYLTGEAFASQWGAQRLARTCASVSRVGAKARPDSSSAIDLAYAHGGVRTSILAGEATFSCTLRSAPAAGYVFAATELVQSQTSSLWDVKALVGFTALEPHAAGAYGVLTHLVASFAIDRAWQARQQAVTAQFDRIVAQTNAAVSQAIINNGRALAAASAAQFQHSQQNANANFNEIEKYDAYGVRGTSDFVNPDTGSRYGFLDNSYAHTYVNNDHEILQTDSEHLPGLGWHELHVAPGG